MFCLFIPAFLCRLLIIILRRIDIFHSDESYRVALPPTPDNIDIYRGGRPKKTWNIQVVEESRMIGLREEDESNRVMWMDGRRVF